MKTKTALCVLAVAGGMAFGWYTVEPWAVTFVDDGPYYSSEFPDSVADLPIRSRVQLRRLGTLAYTLESRLLPTGQASVLVLRDAANSILWARLPVKPDGELGAVELCRASITWYGGWRVRIVPAFQELGDLYLGSLGGFRFFNHSW